MVRLEKKLNKQNFYLDDASTIEEYINNVLKWTDQFYYKNVSYEIIFWDDKKWAIQLNAYEDENAPERKEDFFEGTVQGFAKMLETYKLHDGTLLYDALTKPGYNKYFGYNPNVKYD